MTDKPWQEWPRRDLLNVPQQPYQAHSGWGESLLLIPTRARHESGYAYFAVVGCTTDGPKERILDYDVVNIWDREDAFYNIDCLWPSGVFRIFRQGSDLAYDYGRITRRKREGEGS